MEPHALAGEAIRPGLMMSTPSGEPARAAVKSPNAKGKREAAASIVVDVPTFADRTRFLRRQLEFFFGKVMKDMDLEALCEHERSSQ